jgi:hypothetical protein
MAAAVAFEQAMTFQLAQVVAELIQPDGLIRLLMVIPLMRFRTTFVCSRKLV